MTAAHPEHWRSYSGPANWYQLWHPPTWEVQETGGCAYLNLPDNGGTLAINAYWLPAGRPQLEAVADLPSLFPHRRAVRPLRPLDGPYPSIALAGEAIVGPRPAWWRRLLRRGLWRRWRLWAVCHNSVCLVAVYLPGDTVDHELDTLAGMILNTLAFADSPADPPDLFEGRVVRLARARFPLLACERKDGFQLQLGESHLNLFNFYRAYTHEPERFEQIVLPALTTLVQVQEWGTNQTEPPLERVRDRIMPMLYPEAVWRESFSNFIGNPWVADLTVLYVVDESHAYWYIREDLLDQWDIDRDGLHAIALENLDAYFERNAMEFTLAGEEDGPRVLMPNRPDAYNTSRLLSSAFHRKLQDLLGGEFAVGVPSRDFFVAVSLDNEETIDQVRGKVAVDFGHMDHPLSERLLLVSTDGVSEYCKA